MTVASYIDLNPVRAKMVRRAEDAEHTAFARRVRTPRRRAQPLAPLSALSMTLAEYRALLEWTAAVHHGAVAPPRRAAARVLAGLRQSPDAWLGAVGAHRFRYRAYGALELLRRHAAALGQRYLHGARAGMAAPA